MAFDEVLAARIRKALARKKGVEEKKMFGGIVFMLNGNMPVGVWKDSLIVRLGDEEAEAALLEPHVKPFDITYHLRPDVLPRWSWQAARFSPACFSPHGHHASARPCLHFFG